MLTVKDIKNYASQTNTRFEEHFPNSYVPYQKEYSYTIGMEFKKDVWYWWDVMSFREFTTDDTEIWFNHRYNRTNGATIKGWRTGYKAEQKIKDELKVDFFIENQTVGTVLT